MKVFNLIFICLTLPYLSFAQDDLSKMLDDDSPTTEKPLVHYSFKGTRLINLQTVETLRKGSLDFRISHRFGNFSSGSFNFWGLDGPANIRLGLDYSITDHFTIGIGRSSLGKLADGFLKYKLLSQRLAGGTPVTITILSSLNIVTTKNGENTIAGVSQFNNFPNRFSYLFQALVARKFNEKLSLQVTPTFIHYNLKKEGNRNDVFAIAGSGRFKISKRIAITGEYIFRLNNYASPDIYHNSAGIGIDIETGGHVFQLFVTNSMGINEVQFIPYTEASWKKGQIRLGFNVSRVFSLNRKNKSAWTK